MAQFASDSFTDTAGTTLTGHSANWTKHSSSGSTSLVITDANRFRVSTVDASDSIYYRTETPGSANYSVSMTFRKIDDSSGALGVCARMDTSANTFYMARYMRDVGAGLSAWQLYKRVAGTFTQLGSNSTETLSTGVNYGVRIEVSGSSIKCFKAGDSTAKVDQPDSSIPAAGKAGIRAIGYTSTNTTSTHGDDFSADDLASTGTSRSFGFIIG